MAALRVGRCRRAEGVLLGDRPQCECHSAPAAVPVVPRVQVHFGENIGEFSFEAKAPTPKPFTCGGTMPRGIRWLASVSAGAAVHVLWPCRHCGMELPRHMGYHVAQGTTCERANLSRGSERSFATQPALADAGSQRRR